MDNTVAWWLQAKCASLTPEQADSIFFGPRGSKPRKAKEFCIGCPTRSNCLNEAVLNKAYGFQCGTTDVERRHMGYLIRDSIRDLRNMMPSEPDPTNRPIYLKVFSPPDHHEWMDEVEPPDTLIAALDAVPPLSEVWESIPVRLAS